MRLRRSCLAASLSGLILSTPAVADDETVGPAQRVLSYGILQLAGEASREETLGTTTRRETEIVVSEVHGTWPQAKVDHDWAILRWVRASSTTGWWPFDTTYFAETIDLEKGYAYVKMHDAGSQLVPPIPEGVFLVLRDPSRYLPAVIDTLRLEAAAAARLWTVVPTIEPATWVRINKPGTEDADPLWHDQFKRIDDINELVSHLGAARAEVTDENRMAGLRIIELAMAGESLLPYMGFLNYPFIIARRSVGGAEGTEIVIYAKPINATKAEIYYFYLFSDEPQKPVEVAAYWFDELTNQDQMLGTPEEVDMCHFARVPLQLFTIDGEQRWCMQAPGNIVVAPIDSSLDPELKKVLMQAHRDACLAGIDPTSPIECNGIALACPDDDDEAPVDGGSP